MGVGVSVTKRYMGVGGYLADRYVTLILWTAPYLICITDAVPVQCLSMVIFLVLVNSDANIYTILLSVSTVLLTLLFNLLQCQPAYGDALYGATGIRVYIFSAIVYRVLWALACK